MQAISLRFFKAGDPLLNGTIDAIVRDLGRERWLLRYRHNDGLGIQVDATANAGLKAPTITSIKATAGGQNVNGTFSGLANTKYDINIFTNAMADPSGENAGVRPRGKIRPCANHTCHIANAYRAR